MIDLDSSEFNFITTYKMINYHVKPVISFKEAPKRRLAIVERLQFSPAVLLLASYLTEFYANRHNRCLLVKTRASIWI